MFSKILEEFVFHTENTQRNHNMYETNGAEIKMKFDARGCEGDLEKPWNIVFIIMSFMTTGKLLTYTLSLIATKNLCAFFFSFLLFLSC